MLSVTLLPLAVVVTVTILHLVDDAVDVALMVPEKPPSHVNVVSAVTPAAD